MKITDGIAYFKNLVTDSLTANTISVGSPSKPNGITLYDDVSGEPYCLKIHDGEAATTPGECANAEVESSDPEAIISEDVESADTESPSIHFNGSSVIEVEKGSLWADPGATVTDNVNDNLGIHYQVDGVDVSEVQIDTTVIGEHTIIYTAIDQAGNVGRATRKISVINPPSVSLEPPEVDAITTTSTTTPEE